MQCPGVYVTTLLILRKPTEFMDTHVRRGRKKKGRQLKKVRIDTLSRPRTSTQSGDLIYLDFTGRANALGSTIGLKWPGDGAGRGSNGKSRIEGRALAHDGRFPRKDRPSGESEMTKADLVEEVVRTSSLSKKHAETIVNTVFHSIIEALQRDDKVELRGFGSFRLRRRRSRQGRNPKTGDRVEVPAKRIPYFKPGKELKDLINSDDTGHPDPPALAEPAGDP